MTCKTFPSIVRYLSVISADLGTLQACICCLSETLRPVVPVTPTVALLLVGCI
jgi:hypothetical protein